MPDLCMFDDEIRQRNPKNVVYPDLDHTVCFSGAKLASAFLLNPRSVNNKVDCVKDFIVTHDADFAFLVESWLFPSQKFIDEYSDQMLPVCTGRDDHVIRSLVPKGYKLLHLPRCNRLGGGVAMIFKSVIKVSPQLSSTGQASFEYMEVIVKCSSQSIRFVLVYRPPPSSENRLTVPLFMREFTVLLEELAVSNHETVILGDLNFYCESNCLDACRFLELMSMFGYKQNVTFPTNGSGHTLDVVFTRQATDKPIVTNVVCHDPKLSDHKAVCFDIVMKKPPFKSQTISLRNIKKINSESFINEIVLPPNIIDLISNDNIPDMSLFPNVDICTQIDECVSCYNSVLGSLLDKHAPLFRKTVTIRPKADWYTSEIDMAKRERRRLEHRWLKSKDPCDELAYQNQCQVVTGLIDQSKRSYYNNKIAETHGDQKQLFGLIQKIFHKNSDRKLPSHDSLSNLTQQFADFFVSKIDKIRESFPANDSVPFYQDHEFNGECMYNFKRVDDNKVREFLLGSPNKSCHLDPVPTTLLKQCADKVIPLITLIVNLSLSAGHMSRELKCALLTPLIKKITDDQEVLANFRPISNLPFLSKLIEKIVADQLISHMNENNLCEIMLSSYKKLHSTETALNCVLDDILRGIDDRRLAILLLLDMSAGFDTVDHSILIKRLELAIGLRGNVLKWFKSYLSDRSQTVTINGTSSTSSALMYGVPQGSVLGPILFNIYITPLANLIRSHEIPFHIYADDSQKYAIFELKDYYLTVSKMELLANDIRNWFRVNKLKGNDSKTEVLLMSSKYSPLSNEYYAPLTVGNCSVKPVNYVRNLGVTLDKHISLEKHVKTIVTGAFLKIREIAFYRKYLTYESAKTLMHAYVTSRIDYCNSLLYGLPNNLIKKLQSVLNAAARVVTMTRKFDHISPVLFKLHWLPVKFRIQFKLILLVYKALNGLAPKYLSDKLSVISNKKLRSSDHKLLAIPRTRTKTYGDRSFSVAGPRLWNNLPKQLRLCSSVDVFKKDLKTHLFRNAFPKSLADTLDD